MVCIGYNRNVMNQHNFYQIIVLTVTIVTLRKGKNTLSQCHNQKISEDR